MQPIHADLARRYPQLFNFLETTLWPDVDGVNLLELLHRCMRHGSAENVSRLVEEFERIADDHRFSVDELVSMFTTGVPVTVHPVTKESARSFTRMLGFYLRYLYDVDGVRGRQ
jgi:hypothetical protein